MISNERWTVPAGDHGATGLLHRIEDRADDPALRWYITEAGPDGVVVEAAVWHGRPFPALPQERTLPPSGRAVVVNLVPTGVGCEIGGYAGDAAPVTELLAASCDVLVTNPNAVNASNFIRAGAAVWYTEGACIDLFLRGRANLYRPRANRVGLIVERAGDQQLAEVFNVVNTVRAVHGVDVVAHVVTDEPLGTRCARNPSGAFVGLLDRPDVLLAAGRRLVEAGATALAVTSNVQDLPGGDYVQHFRGEAPNPVGGAEALISHLLVRSLQVPAAHAPMINHKPEGETGLLVDPRSAGEYVSASGLACVLIGLATAPQLVRRPGDAPVAAVDVDDTIAVVAPSGALGGVPVLEAVRRGIPVVAVRANRTILDVTAARLGLPGVIEVGGYTEAAGVVTALRHGIALESLRRPLAATGAEKVVPW